MGLWLGDRVLDNGLAVLDAECDKIFVCSQQPTTYTEASATYALGVKDFGAGNAFGAAGAGSPSGRITNSTAITDGSVTADGTVSHWAAVDSVNSRLLATDVVSGGRAVTNGQQFTLASFAVHMVGASGAAAATTWNAADKVFVDLTGSDLIATINPSDGGVRAVSGIVDTNKKYFEIVVTNTDDASTYCCGLADLTYVLGTIMLNSPNAFAYRDGGLYGFNSIDVVGLSYTDGDNIGFAVDRPNGTLWHRKNGGNWSGSASDDSSANPATNTNGYSIAGWTGTVFPCFRSPANGMSQTAKFASADWTYAAPSGFTQINLP